jgi:hypothetical protein
MLRNVHQVLWNMIFFHQIFLNEVWRFEDNNDGCWTIAIAMVLLSFVVWPSCALVRRKRLGRKSSNNSSQVVREFLFLAMVRQLQLCDGPSQQTFYNTWNSCYHNPTSRRVWGWDSHSRNGDLGVLWDSQKFRVRLQGSKHLALGRSLYHWKAMEM